MHETFGTEYFHGLVPDTANACDGLGGCCRAYVAGTVRHRYRGARNTRPHRGRVAVAGRGPGVAPTARRPSSHRGKSGRQRLPFRASLDFHGKYSGGKLVCFSVCLALDTQRSGSNGTGAVHFGIWLLGDGALDGRIFVRLPIDTAWPIAPLILQNRYYRLMRAILVRGTNSIILFARTTSCPCSGITS